MMRYRDLLVLLALLAYLILEVFSGPLRMYLSLAGLSPLIYLPKAMLVAATLWVLIDEPMRAGFTHRGLLGLLVVLTACVIGLLYCGAKQMAVGIWVLVPFWYGLVCAAVIRKHFHKVLRWVPVLWLCAATGILLNYSITWPWEGFGYSVGGMEVEGSRKWWASGGIKRIAGFSRSSFDASVQVVLLGALATLATKSVIRKLIIWATSAVAIYLTTSKGIFLVYIALTPFVLGQAFIPRTLLQPMPALIGCLGLALPLSTLAFTFTPDKSGQATLVNALYSFYDRLNHMWPEAWRLLHEHGHFMFGRGIGGIGTAQTYVEPLRFNAADNLFMYWFVIFGWLALPAFVLLLLASTRLEPKRLPVDQAIFALLIATLVYGLSTNIVENAAFAISAGLAIRHLTSTPGRLHQLAI